MEIKVISQIQQEFRTLADPEKAKLLGRYFKTGKGEYAEGDRFYGVMVPQTRAIVKKYAIRATLPDLVHKSKSDESITSFYLKHTKYINNWDLVDTSAPYILGPYLFEHPNMRTILFKLARSKNLWERRIAIITTLYFIKQRRFDETIKIAKMLLRDSHDLIHKAVGWALRELGKQDERTLRAFLDAHAPAMPRTMLRYAIEQFSTAYRAQYMTSLKKLVV